MKPNTKSEPVKEEGQTEGQTKTTETKISEKYLNFGRINNCGNLVS